MGELNSRVAGQLQEEARAVAGRSCRVFLANDYYTFTVPPRDPVPMDQVQMDDGGVERRRHPMATGRGQGQRVQTRR